MHSDTWSICAIACGDAAPAPGPPPGSRCLQDAWADWNAGACGLTPEFAPITSWTPPPDLLGSGKFGAPWARMQAENASVCE
jgi:hypothetical protein